MQAILQFKKYKVLEQIYKNNFEHVKRDKKLNKPSIGVEVGVAEGDSSQGLVILEVELGDEVLEEFDSYVKVKIAGLFEIAENNAELSEDEIHSFYKVNAVAILFPYLRSLVSELTSKGDDSPIILPTINVDALMQEKEE